MKCPKCGYVSFEYLDQCKKCGRDISQFKAGMKVVTFAPGVLNVFKYTGLEESVKDAAPAADADESAIEVKLEAQEKKEIEISLPEEETIKPSLATAKAPAPQATEEKKEEIILTIEDEEHKTEEKQTITGNEKSVPVEEITLSLEDIVNLDDKENT